MPHNASSLDLLRSIAVLFVVVSHLPIPIFSNQYYDIHALGLLGVLMFFVHTSLVLMYSLERQSLYTTKGLILSFWIRRFFRIYALSIFMVCIYSYYNCYIKQIMHINLSTFLSNILLIQNITNKDSLLGALWSLPFEVQMYILLPFIYLLILKYQRRASLIIYSLWLIMVLFILILYNLKLNYNIPKYIPCFLPGILAFTLYKSKVKVIMPQVIFLILIVVLAVTYPVLVKSGYKENLIAWPLCLLLGFIIPRTQDVVNKVVKKVAHIIAKYSYGIYLVHGPVITIIFHDMESKLSLYTKVTLTLVITGVAAFLLYHLLEKPFINLGLKLTRPRLDFQTIKE